MRVASAAMLDHAIGPNIINTLTNGFEAFLERHADRGWRTLEDFRGSRRDRIVSGFLAGAFVAAAIALAAVSPDGGRHPGPALVVIFAAAYAACSCIEF